MGMNYFIGFSGYSDPLSEMSNRKNLYRGQGAMNGLQHFIKHKIVLKTNLIIFYLYTNYLVIVRFSKEIINMFGRINLYVKQIISLS